MKDKDISPATLIAAILSGGLENATIAATPGGIEAQESAGQKKFVANQTLPKNCPRQELKSLGFVFGKDADDLFVTVQFPEGWTKQATNHSMWSDLLDEKGRRRASIFYKTAFYDRDAFLNLLNRYKPSYTYDEPRVAQIKDGEKVIWESEPVETNDKESYEVSDQLGVMAKKEIDERFPDWKNPLAYWD